MKKEQIIKDGASTNGTCYQTSFNASKEQLVELFGEPSYSDKDLSAKSQNEWLFGIERENALNAPVTIYDWKEYREYDDDETIEWHIGALDNAIALEFADYVKSQIDVK